MLGLQACVIISGLHGAGAGAQGFVHAMQAAPTELNLATVPEFLCLILLDTNRASRKFLFLFVHDSGWVRGSEKDWGMGRDIAFGFFAAFPVVCVYLG